MPNKPARILPFRPERGETQGLAGALNLGPSSAAWLEAAGIKTLSQVKKLGPIETCRLLLTAGRPVAVTMAYALEGALSGCHWNQLSPETKLFLRQAFAQMKKELTSSAVSHR